MIAGTAERRRLIAHLKRGGRVTRDEYGGAVGVAWSSASRNGNLFDAPAAEKQLLGGCKIGGHHHELVMFAGSARTFQLSKVAAS